MPAKNLPTIKSTDLFSGFSARMCEFCNEQEVPYTKRSEFLAKLTGLAKSGIDKWLTKDCPPKTRELYRIIGLIAPDIDTRAKLIWLLYGIDTGVNYSGSHTSSPNPLTAKSLAYEMHCQYFDNWADIPRARHSITSEVETSLPQKKTSRFVLKVSGESMLCADPKQSFPPGCIIVVDPMLEPQDGDFIIARLESDSVPVLRVLVKENEVIQYAKSLNDSLPTTRRLKELTISSEVSGVVVRRIYDSCLVN
ncbi:MAG: S24 family peptidase [Pseudomonadota bacterium]